MSFKYKIIKWNISSVCLSLFISVFLGIVTFRYLFTRFYGNITNIEFILNSSSFRAFMTQFFLAFSIYFIISLLICNIVMVIKINKNLIQPLHDIKQGALEIMEGNLDYRFNYYTDDETGELIKAFNEMQINVKKTIHKSVENQQRLLELISEISHDLRTPVTTIKGYADGILDGVANTEEKKKKYLIRIKTKAADLENLIQQLLYAAKSDMNKISYRFEKIDIVYFVTEIVDEIRLDLNNQKTEVDISDFSNCKTVMIDPPRLKRVLLNILDNSIQYKNSCKNRIQIKFQNEAGFIVLSFEDNGIGIPPEKLPYIFNSFYRCDESRNDTGNSGLGLFISRIIVEGHKGKIWAKSKKDKGTVIYISFPYITEAV